MTRPYLHPNGFIHVNLTPTKRLHIWHPDLPQAQKVYTPIHDHTFYFTSRILAGALIHTTYGAFLTNEEDATHRHYAVDTRQEILVPTDKWCEVVKLSREMRMAGDYYDFGGIDNFHTSEAHPEVKSITATIMTVTGRDLNYPRANAHVLIPWNTEPDNEFRRDGYPVEKLLPFVVEAMKSMDWRYVYTDE